jgi:transposase
MIARLYGISYNTLQRWIKKIPSVGIAKGQRVLTPKQTAALFEAFGRPASGHK